MAYRMMIEAFRWLRPQDDKRLLDSLVHTGIREDDLLRPLTRLRLQHGREVVRDAIAG